MRFLICVFLFLVSVKAMAVTIMFPKDELARESVLPVFENTLAVRSRLVPTEGRLEFGFSSGFALNEPFFKTLRYGGHIAYHFTETHGLLFEGRFYQKGLNNNGKSLATKNFDQHGDEKVTEYIRMEYAPQPEYHFVVNYQMTAYYGKISVLKDFVMNLSLYGLFGVGTVSVGGENVPALNLGLGQKFYFNKNWGLRTDLGVLVYQGVNYFAAKDGDPYTPLLDSTRPSAPRFEPTQKKPSEFESNMAYDTRISLSLIFLI